MDTRNQEIDQFKREINLSEYAAALGYSLDVKESSRNSAVMRDTAGDKIIIGRQSQTGHWIYFSVRDDQDNGTIIDFAQNRRRLSLGELRQELRPWIGAAELPSRPQPRPASFAPELIPSSKDIAAVQLAFARCVPGVSAYLTGRGINAAVQSSERFSGAIFTDQRSNTIFPHRNADGICGFEIKNQGFTGFAKGGEKGLWCSRAMRGDDTAVFTETAIDALSYFALEGHGRMRFFSVGGALNPETQPGLIQAAAAKLPEGGTVIIATDNDEGGDMMAVQIVEAVTAAGRDDLRIVEDRAADRGADWNDALQGALSRFSFEP